MELVLGFVALGAGVLLFIGANLVALVLMVGGPRSVRPADNRHP